ncbi:MAG: hypothetical protein R3327_02810 [Nitrosopumilaceae archaeon]|nr:hypothetical protein [Nitrosopumilaceae archaeon]
MKKYDEIKVGDEFFSTCSISERELEEYLNFSRVRNAFLDEMKEEKNQIISGRAILSRMEGEFTRLSQIYGNHIIFVGTDGDPDWKNRNTRFLKPLTVNEVLKIKFIVSGKEDINDEFGKIAIDFEGTNQGGDLVVVSKKNIYRIKKELNK